MHQPSRCPNCGEENVIESEYCLFCGTYFFPDISEKPTEYKSNSIPSQNKQNTAIVIGTIIIILIFIISIISLSIINFIEIQNDVDNISPFIVRTDPADGANDVEPEFSLRIFFNEPVTPSNDLHHDFWQITTNETETRWIDDRTAEIVNLRFQYFGTHTFRIYSEIDIQDDAGNIMSEDYDLNLTTRPPNVDILSIQTYQRPEDTMIYVYGEVKNQENFSLMLIEFNVSAFDANQNYLGTSIYGSITSPIIIESGETVPYMSYYRDHDDTVESIVVEVINQGSIELMNRYKGLEIIDTENSYGTYDNYTFYIINGSLFNNGNELAENIVITATYYDSNGSIVGAYDYALEPQDLNATETMDFEIEISDRQCDVLSIDSYQLMAHEMW